MPYKDIEKKRQYNREYLKHKYHTDPEEKKSRILKSRKKNKLQIVNNKIWYAEYKATLSCSSCGFNHPAALQFHHIDPSTKKSEVSSMVASAISRKTIIKEIEKCIVLCANCHMILHAENRLK